MSVRKLTATLILACVALCGYTSVQAQEYAPVADPFEFDPDFRWFEPMSQLDFDDMKPMKRASTGWFGSYDRLRLFGSRPEIDDPNASEDGLDGGWGHRYEVGYMLPSVNKGWMFAWTNNDVAQSSFVRQEALNRYNGGELEGNASGDIGALAPPFGFPTPPGEGNNLGYYYRFYDVTDTENVFSYNNFELNKTWRMEPYHYGGILEPLVGLRYMRVTDTNIFQTYQSSIDEIPFFYAGTSAAEQLISREAITSNEMLGGQIGFRYFKQRNRFTFSSDFRAFGGGSFQRSRTQTNTDIVIYDLGGTTITIGDPPDAIINRKTTPIYTRNDENFFGFDIRGEIGYQLSKSISLRGGFQLIDIASGVWRGGPQDGGRSPIEGGDQDQNLVQVGYTFGVTLNR